MQLSPEPWNNASIIVTPKGGPRAYVGHFTLIAFLIHRNLTKTLGLSVETFDYFARGNGTKSLCGHLKLVFVENNMWGVMVSTYFQQIEQLLLTALALWRLHGFLIDSFAICQTIRCWS